MLAKFYLKIRELIMALAKSPKNDITSLLKEGIFYVPNYQRRYSWTRKEQKAIFDDIKDAMENGEDRGGRWEHFLGTLALDEDGVSKDKTKYNIIDGQQRFTTLLIMLNEIINKIRDKNIGEDLKKTYIIENHIPKLSPIDDEDKSFLIKILLGEKIDASSIKKGSHKNMLDARRLFRSEIKSSFEFDIDFEELFYNICKNTKFLIIDLIQALYCTFRFIIIHP